MTTNDNTRLNEKIFKSKGNQNAKKEEKAGMDENQHIKMMVRSSSEPRLYIQWDDMEADEEESGVDGHE